MNSPSAPTTQQTMGRRGRNSRAVAWAVTPSAQLYPGRQVHAPPAQIAVGAHVRPLQVAVPLPRRTDCTQALGPGRSRSASLEGQGREGSAQATGPSRGPTACRTPHLLRTQVPRCLTTATCHTSPGVGCRAKWGDQNMRAIHFVVALQHGSSVFLYTASATVAPHPPAQFIRPQPQMRAIAMFPHHLGLRERKGWPGMCVWRGGEGIAPLPRSECIREPRNTGRP